MEKFLSNTEKMLSLNGKNKAILKEILKKLFLFDLVSFFFCNFAPAVTRWRHIQTY